MKRLRKLFLFTTAILLTWVVVYTYNQLTDGFSLRQMTSSLPPYPQFEVTLSDEEKEALRFCLASDFHYIGKGCQFYAFESADGKYVLKFLKHKHLRPWSWLKSVPMPSKLREISNTKIERRRERVENLFSSCKLAFEEMKEETGLLFVHLNRSTMFDTKVTIKDKLGLKYCIRLDDYEYILQRKALPVKDVFARITTEDELRARIEQLIEIVISRCEKGIADRDRSFVQNVAFCAQGSGALFIDTGQFYKDQEMRTAEAQAKDVQKRLNNLHFWVQRHFPDFAPVVESYKQQLQML